MKFIERIKNLLAKVSKKTAEIKQDLSAFVIDHKPQILQAMQLADLAYDTFAGSLKMVAVISFFITGVNSKCGTNFNAEQLGTESTKELEAKFQEVYNNLKA